MKISLTIVVISLLIAFVGILTQHGHDTRISRLSLVPLGVYLLIWGTGWLVSALKK